MRVVLLGLLLLLAVAARAQDDDDTPHPPALGPAIPERIQELEKEWGDDVGKDPSEDPKAEPEDDAEPANADHDDDEHEATSKPKLPDPVLPKASKPSALPGQSQGGGSEKRDTAKPTAAPAPGSSPKPADAAPARATAED